MKNKLFALVITIFCLPVFANSLEALTPIPLENLSKTNISEYAFILDAEELAFPANAAALDQLLKDSDTQTAVTTRGNRFWYLFALEANQNQSLWFNISNRLLEHIRLYQIQNTSIDLISETGMRHEPQYPLTYAQKMEAPAGTSYWLIEIEHPYMLGNPHIQLSTHKDFIQFGQFNLLIVIGCIGTILALAPYNLLIGIWSHNKAYYWYSAYLLAVGLQWTTFFSIWDHFFGLNSDFYNFTFFNLYVLFGTNFFLSFLRLNEKHSLLIRVSKLWRYTILMVPGYFIWPTYVHFELMNIVVGGWILLGLISGIVSYADGYRPARFFILGFSAISVAAIITILAQNQVITSIDNTYRLTLIAQTIDVIFLSLALADQINTFRKDRIEALERAYESETNALKSETQASQKLAEANLKLDTALKVALQDKEQKQHYMMLIGHELKTPLHTIYAMLEDAEEDPNQLNWEGLFSSTWVLKRHIGNLLTLAETSTGSVKPAITQVALAPFIKQLTEELRQVFQGDATVQYEGLDQLPKTVSSDPILLHHLLFELMHNAIRFSPDRTVNLSLHYDAPTLSISVKDHGPGFPIDFIEEFKQTQKGLSRTVNGLGVGMSVANNLLSVFGSSLAVSENTPKGACVSFSIEAQEAYSADQANKESLHCLVVEDNPVNLKLLQSMIHKLGHTTAGASNGEEALECHQQQKFDVVFMDIQMPVMDGITATSELRNRGFKAPIYAVTANTELETRHQALDAGVDDIIGKPVKKAIIDDALSKVG